MQLFFYGRDVALRSLYFTLTEVAFFPPKVYCHASFHDAKLKANVLAM
jgi:hypothetical protein